MSGRNHEAASLRAESNAAILPGHSTPECRFEAAWREADAAALLRAFAPALLPLSICPGCQCQSRPEYTFSQRDPNYLTPTR